MELTSLFSALESINKKPNPFSIYTARELWTDEYTSEQMLALHLDGEVDVSSRRTSFIDSSVRWMIEHFALSESSRVIDFGCGPGLYTSRFARLGTEVVGIDFSSRSIEYAEESVADYLPEPVVVELMDGTQVEATCYNLPEDKVTGANEEYAKSLLDVATKLDFPDSYLDQIRQARR